MKPLRVLHVVLHTTVLEQFQYTIWVRDFGECEEHVSRDFRVLTKLLLSILLMERLSSCACRVPVDPQFTET